jgi:hypothetical protein
MQVGLNEAARRTGKDQSTITRACQAGRLSFSKDESGNRLFDIAELERVYGPLRKPEEQPVPTADTAAITESLERAHAAEVTGLQREIRRLEDQVRLLETQCSQWQGKASQITRQMGLKYGPAVSLAWGSWRRVPGEKSKPTPRRREGKMLAREAHA